MRIAMLHNVVGPVAAGASVAAATTAAATEARPPLPITEAAHDAYPQLAQDGWETHDVMVLVEYSWRAT